MKELMLILSNFVKNPKETGAVAPSSRFLTKEIISNIEFESSENIIELGPGLGTFTKEILKKAKPSAKMFCFEVNKGFCSYLNENINDGRMTVINEGAESISRHLKKFKLDKADCIVSGLPFLSFDDSKRKKILNEVKNSLSDNGSFILFQYTSKIESMLQAYFCSVEKSFVPLNVPPSFVYICRK